MDRSQQFTDGHRRGIKECVAWLHTRAEEMNDEHAKHLLHSAATNLGWQKRQITQELESPFPRLPPQSRST